ncbi:uncharacterized protein G2W53_041205 [Senna tora]|uniref:Uncharacterized protein n=1 Tax=Senna tora TaxID=362788 RepID=A0A834SRK6_9FABA|nr:uncharacterized protein G2W53_041205 [Senna tora]
MDKIKQFLVKGSIAVHTKFEQERDITDSQMEEMTARMDANHNDVMFRMEAF